MSIGMDSNRLRRYLEDGFRDVLNAAFNGCPSGGGDLALTEDGDLAVSETGDLALTTDEQQTLSDEEQKEKDRLDAILMGVAAVVAATIESNNRKFEQDLLRAFKQGMR